MPEKKWLGGVGKENYLTTEITDLPYDRRDSQ